MLEVKRPDLVVYQTEEMVVELIPGPFSTKQRTCKEPGCNTKLPCDNQSGYCQLHHGKHFIQLAHTPEVHAKVRKTKQAKAQRRRLAIQKRFARARKAQQL